MRLTALSVCSNMLWSFRHKFESAQNFRKRAFNMTSIFAFFSHDMPFAERFRLTKQAGFDAVMLWWGDDDTDQDHETQPELCRKAGLAIDNMHIPFFGTNNLWNEGPMGDFVLNHHLKCIDDCVDHGIPTAVMHAIFGGNLPPVNDIGLKRFWDIANHAEKKGINVAVENLRETNLHAAHVLEHIDAPRLGFCFDSGHWNACKDKSPEFDLFTRFGHRLMTLHLNDNHGEADDHLLPFNGTVDWPATMAAIKATGFTGYTGMEFNLTMEGLTPEEWIVEAHKRVMKLEAMRHA